MFTVLLDVELSNTENKIVVDICSSTDYHRDGSRHDWRGKRGSSICVGLTILVEKEDRSTGKSLNDDTHRVEHRNSVVELFDP